MKIKLLKGVALTPSQKKIILFLFDLELKVNRIKYGFQYIEIETFDKWRRIYKIRIFDSKLGFNKYLEVQYIENRTSRSMLNRYNRLRHFEIINQSLKEIIQNKIEETKKYLAVEQNILQYKINQKENTLF